MPGPHFLPQGAISDLVQVSAKAVEFPEAEPPWGASRPILVHDNTTADMLSAKAFAVEEWHPY